jgi:tricarballylate dehydrogenase
MRVAHDVGNDILTDPYPVAEFWDDLLHVTDGETDRDLAWMTLEQSKELWDFLHAQGVRYQPSLGGTLSLSRTNAFFLGGGKTMLNALYHMAEDLGVECRYETTLIDITIDNGMFRSATLECDRGREAVSAGSFVAASGGFEANLDWLTKAWGTAAQNFLIRGTPYNRGEVLDLLFQNGVAAVGDATQGHAVAIDGRAPKFDGGIVTRLDCVPFGVVLNANGKRFYDEGEDFWPKRYAIWGRLLANQPEQIGHVIIDAKSIQLFMPSVFDPEQAESIEALADKIGLDPPAARASIEAFNAACTGLHFDHTTYDNCHTEGIDPPKSHWARPIDTPPFYAYTLRPGITFTYLGVKVNHEARMVMANDSLSPNMFAAGEIMAGNVLGQGYLAGIGMTIGSVFGRLAGQGAAANV